MKKIVCLLALIVAAVALPSKAQLVAADDDTRHIPLSVSDSLLLVAGLRGETPRAAKAAPWQLREAVFESYSLQPPLEMDFDPALPEGEAFRWLADELFNARLMRQTRQAYMLANPASVRYNAALLPEAPERYTLAIDPQTARLSFVADTLQRRIPALGSEKAINVSEIKKQHWLHTFDGALQFSQAYISPNWYQGGSNNLTMMLNLAYSLRLNRNYHPDMLAEIDVSYKLHVYGTPEDSLRNYNISEDLFQFAGKFGWRAWRKWFYSISVQFKTQFFNNYEVNDPLLKSTFLSPSELNLGLGMTYEWASPRKSAQLTLSLSPLAYNLRTCLDRRLDPSDFGIDNHRRFINEIGSGLTCNFLWQLRENISYTTRLFAFTNYKGAQGDWENTFSFAITRFLSTQLFVHLRYDSFTPRPAKQPSRWHKWQLKEILSFGFAYKFATI